MWIAVLCSVKLFPNLEDALKGVFNRVLKNLRKASTRFHREERLVKCSSFFSKKSMLAGGFQTCSALTKVFQALKNNLKPRAPSSHPPSRFQARTRDRAVTAGAQSHGTAHRLRAYQPAVKLAKMARKRAQRRWRRAAHAICLAGACSCTLGDAPVGRRCHARQRVLQGQPPSASRFSAAWPERLR